MRKKIYIAIVYGMIAPAVCFGVMRADFPNQKNLQPMPSDVTPNISNNINYDGSEPVQLPSNVEQSNPSVSLTGPVNSHTSRNYIWIIVIFVVVAISAVLAWLYTWYNKGDV